MLKRKNQAGYRPVTTGLPPGYSVGPDGFCDLYD